jgi:hypothetical protein
MPEIQGTELGGMFETSDAQHRRDMFEQTNQAAIDFSKLTLMALLLANGLPALVILLAGLLGPDPVIIVAPFAWGVVWAIVALAISYCYIMLLCETWRVPPPPSVDEPYYSIGHFPFTRRKLVSYRTVEKLRMFAILPAAVSFVYLVKGVIKLS